MIEEVQELRQAVEDVKYRLDENQIVTLIHRHIVLAKQQFGEGIENYKGLFNFADGTPALKKCNRIVFGAHGPYIEFEEEDTPVIPIYGFFENDSQDNTAQILEEWLKDRVGFVVAETINAPKWGSVSSLDRVRYQARYRNSALALLNRFQYDYLLHLPGANDCVIVAELLYVLYRSGLLKQ